MTGLQCLPFLLTAVFPCHQFGLRYLAQSVIAQVYHYQLSREQNEQTNGGRVTDGRTQISENCRSHVAAIHRSALHHTPEDSNIKPITY